MGGNPTPYAPAGAPGSLPSTPPRNAQTERCSQEQKHRSGSRPRRVYGLSLLKTIWERRYRMKISKLSLFFQNSEKSIINSNLQITWSCLKGLENGKTFQTRPLEITHLRNRRGKQARWTHSLRGLPEDTRLWFDAERPRKRGVSPTEQSKRESSAPRSCAVEVTCHKDSVWNSRCPEHRENAQGNRAAVMWGES